jgi:hypothetical protein
MNEKKSKMLLKDSGNVEIANPFVNATKIYE